MGIVKSWIGFRLGMVNIENVVIACLVVVSMGLQYIFLRLYVRIARESTVYLDSSLAEALSTILESLPEVLEEKFQGQIEPMNPIQSLVAQYLSQQMSPPMQATIVNRGEDGKFSSDTSL